MIISPRAALALADAVEKVNPDLAAQLRWAAERFRQVVVSVT